MYDIPFLGPILPRCSSFRATALWPDLTYTRCEQPFSLEPFAAGFKLLHYTVAWKQVEATSEPPNERNLGFFATREALYVVIVNQYKIRWHMHYRTKLNRAKRGR